MLNKKITILFCLFILIITISGCSTITNKSGVTYRAGIYIYPEKLEQIKPGLSQKDIFELLGSPSFISTFSKKTWFYVYQKTWYIAIFREKLIDQQILVLNFDDNGILTTVEYKTTKDSRLLNYDNNKTLFYYKKNNITPDLLK